MQPGRRPPFRRRHGRRRARAQIGIECSPCDADCDFCSFGASHAGFTAMRLDEQAFIERVEGISKNKDIYGLFLMTMHEYDLDYYLDDAGLKYFCRGDGTRVH